MLVGIIVVIYRKEVRPFSDKQIESRYQLPRLGLSSRLRTRARPTN